ncbi:MAG TPA: hydrogen peroxide-dependent heme synthase [Terracidiphilus sp.]|nr:hydrogen peroxide-dependent heme synthase [Terracidiphilus sp.]
MKPEIEVVPLSDFPAVPLTLEGSCLLHQFYRFNRPAWRRSAGEERARAAAEAAEVLKGLERAADGSVQTAIYSQLGHKGDLMLIHFRDSMEALNQVELDLAQTPLFDFLELKHSYVSVVELGLYESSRKTWEAAAAKGLTPHTEEWNAEVETSMTRGAEAMKSRLFPAVPEAKYLSFYPMDRKRSADGNWYTVPFAERQRMMHEHGLIGRRYGDRVKQIISGSIGMDDWEWGVDLFADDPVVFKKLIYEMRFDEVSAVYALFGQFFLGIRLPVEKLGGWLQGKLES